MRAFILAVTGLVVGLTACSSDGTTFEVYRKPVAAVSVVLPAPSLIAGQTARAVATPLDADGTALPNRLIVWESSSSAIASVTDSGMVSAMSPGSALISATSEGQTGSATLTVASTPSVPVTSVSVTLGVSSRNPGQTTQASATTRDANNSVLTGRAIIWSSSNPGVATVSGSGLVTAIAVGTAQILASCEGQVGNATFTVTSPSQAAVATVSVAFGDSSLSSGSTTQATATTRDANNNVLTGRTIAWKSNSGAATVSASGLVTAITAGTAQITATSEGQSGSTALNVQSPPPPPPPGSSNEPTGMTAVIDEPFNAVVPTGWDYEVGSLGFLSIKQDAAAPKSPSNYIQMLFPAGFVAGGSPATLESGLGSRYTTMYVSFWIKFSSNWVGHSTGVNKEFHFWVGGLNRAVIIARGSGSGPLSAEILLQGITAGGNFDGGTNANFSANVNSSAATVARGQWAHYEVVFKDNTAGNKDGAVDWWLDGVKVGSYSGIQYTSGASTWELMKLSPTWGGLGGVIGADQFMSLDHLYISGK